MIATYLSAFVHSGAFVGFCAWLTASVFAVALKLLDPRFPRAAALSAALAACGLDPAKLAIALGQLVTGKASPGLAGVVVDADKILALLEASPALQAELDAKQLAKLASSATAAGVVLDVDKLPQTRATNPDEGGPTA
jgi:hypothetical protein